MNIKNLPFVKHWKSIPKILNKYLLPDLANYQFNIKDWHLDFSNTVDEGHDFKISGIGIVNNKTEEHFGGWSNYISTADGKELYIYWDDIGYSEERAQKYGVKSKTEFGVPFHIQEKFSDRLKKEIAEDNHCGSRKFFTDKPDFAKFWEKHK